MKHFQVVFHFNHYRYLFARKLPKKLCCFAKKKKCIVKIKIIRFEPFNGYIIYFVCYRLIKRDTKITDFAKRRRIMYAWPCVCLKFKPINDYYYYCNASHYTYLLDKKCSDVCRVLFVNGCPRQVARANVFQVVPSTRL